MAKFRILSASTWRQLATLKVKNWQLFPSSSLHHHPVLNPFILNAGCKLDHRKKTKESKPFTTWLNDHQPTNRIASGLGRMIFGQLMRQNTSNFSVKKRPLDSSKMKHQSGICFCLKPEPLSRFANKFKLITSLSKTRNPGTNLMSNLIFHFGLLCARGLISIGLFGWRM